LHAVSIVGGWPYLKTLLVRSNTIVRLLDEPIEAVIVVSGGGAYVSADWYDIENQVPTLNCVAVRINGALEQLDDQELRGILDKLSADYQHAVA